MANLLKETITVIEEYGGRIEEIQWVGSNEFGWFTWEDFKAIANIEYDMGFGAAKIAEDLLIIGSEWWLERHEYDGLEWWEFKEVPSKPENYNKPKSVKTNNVGWETLSQMNKSNIKKEEKAKGGEKPLEIPY